MRILLVVAIAFVLVVLCVPLIMDHYFAGPDGEANATAVMSWAFDQVTDETSGARTGTVIDALAACAASEKRFFAEHGRYARDLTRLDLPAGVSEAAFPDGPASANTSTSHRELTDFHGYLFATVPMNGATRMDYDRDFVVVAFPAFYSVSGTQTYAVGPKGIVISGDTTGAPVFNAADLVSWTVVH